MPRSMTGFGVATSPVGGGRLQCEVRTVNHKHLNIQVRVPAGLQLLEEPVREVLRSRLSRGAVNVQLRWVDEPPLGASVDLDLERARAVVAALRELRETMGLSGDVDLQSVARFPGVLSLASEADVAAVPTPEVLAVVSEAVTAVLTMRDREGAALAAELRDQLGTIRTALQRVDELSPARALRERDRLRASVTELLDGRTVDEDRLAQEIAFLAERLDVREEIVRLGTHLDAAIAALGRDGGVGRELGFLAQEMLREINTIGSKANDAEIVQVVIGMKGELERFREQLENIE